MKFFPICGLVVQPLYQIPLKSPIMQASSRNLFHPHRFNVHKFPDSMRRELASMSGVLDSSEGYAGIEGYHLVEEDHSRLQFIDEAFGFHGIIGPSAGTQSEAAVIRDPNAFVDCLHAKDGC